MVQDVILSLFGSLGYDFIKQFGIKLFGSSDSELDLRIRKAIIITIDCFFHKYGNKFGRPSESFLAKESNWLIIASSLRLDTPILDISQIDRIGYGTDRIPSDEEIIDLIEIVKNEFHQDLFLDLKLSIKESTNLSKEQIEKLSVAVEKLTHSLSNSTSTSTGKFETFAKGGDLPPHDFFEEGVLYVRNISDKVKLSYMRRHRTIYSEAQLDDGAVMYYEIDENANIKIVMPPYPVVIHIPPEYRGTDEIITDETGNRFWVQHCKYGLKITTRINSDGSYSNPIMEFAQVSINSKDKIMIVKPKNLN